jgi:hypothetical protein
VRCLKCLLYSDPSAVSILQPISNTMSSDQSNPRDSPPTPSRRRSSFVDLFGPRQSAGSQSNPPRRLSITTLGLSTVPGTQTSPYSNMRARAESVSSANSGSVDESPFEDEPSGPPPSASMSSSVSSSMPATPFARRMSFGAKALREPRNGGGSSPNGSGGPAGTANGRPSVSSAAPALAAQKASASPNVKSRGLSCCV